MIGVHGSRPGRTILAFAALALIAAAQAAPSDAHNTQGGPDQLAARQITTTAANSDNDTRRRGCVTRREFRRAKKGMKRGRIVHRIFKAGGQRNPYVPKNRNIWGYSACKRGYFVEVDYTNLRRGKPFRMVRKGWYRQEGGRLRAGAAAIR